MPRRWEHEVSADWLKERNKYITASEIKGLVNVYKRAKKAGWSFETPFKIPEFMALLFREPETFEVDSPSSSAARGHYLEQFAVKEYNGLGLEPTMYHWDDALIHDAVAAYSPDALDIKQVGSEPSHHYLRIDRPSKILEIKSYNEKKHFQVGLSPKEKAEERYQIATAMFIDSHISTGTLVLYNPSLSDYWMMFHTYNREDLKDEIKLVGEIAECYWWHKNYCGKTTLTKHFSEMDIWNKYVMEEQEKQLSIPIIY